MLMVAHFTQCRCNGPKRSARRRRSTTSLWLQPWREANGLMTPPTGPRCRASNRCKRLNCRQIRRPIAWHCLRQPTASVARSGRESGEMSWSSPPRPEAQHWANSCALAIRLPPLTPALIGTQQTTHTEARWSERFVKTICPHCKYGRCSRLESKSTGRHEV